MHHLPTVHTPDGPSRVRNGTSQFQPACLIRQRDLLGSTMVGDLPEAWGASRLRKWILAMPGPRFGYSDLLRPGKINWYCTRVASKPIPSSLTCFTDISILVRAPNVSMSALPGTICGLSWLSRFRVFHALSTILPLPSAFLFLNLYLLVSFFFCNLIYLLPAETLADLDNNGAFTTLHCTSTAWYFRLMPVDIRFDNWKATGHSPCSFPDRDRRGRLCATPGTGVLP